MATLERVSFSISAVTVCLGHKKAVARLVRRQLDLTYNEFCALLLLDTARAPLLLSQIASYLILARKTALTCLSALEDRGFVTKHQVVSDKRRMTVGPTPQGRKAVAQTLKQLDAMFGQILCQNLPAAEFGSHMNAHVMRASLDAIRGIAVDVELDEQTSPFYSVEHLIYWRAMTDSWTRIVHETAQMSFTEFGMLALLGEKGAMPCSSLADALMVHRSEVSTCKNKLVARDFVRELEPGTDARSHDLAITIKGRKLLARAMTALVEFTCSVDTSPDDTTAAIINTWYARMYLNIRSNRDALFQN